MKHATHRRSMRAQHLLLVLVLSVSQCLIFGTLMAQEVKVRSLMSQVMTDVSGKEGLLITVEYPPGGSRCTCISIRAGRLRRDAGKGRKTSDAHTRTDLL